MTVIRKSIVYPHAPADVWGAITDAHALAEWLMPNDFQPVLGHRFTFQTDPHFACPNLRTECEVLEFDPPRRMVWSWVDVAPDGRKIPTRVTWVVTPEGSGARLTLEHEGVERLPWLTRLMMRMGWGVMLRSSLRKVIGGVRDGRFTPGVIPLGKRYYKAKTVPAHLVR